MKTKEELKVLKEELAALKNKLADLNEEELALVTGGVMPDGNGGAIFYGSGGNVSSGSVFTQNKTKQNGGAIFYPDSPISNS